MIHIKENKIFYRKNALCSEIARDISKHQEGILQKITQETIDVYLWLKNQSEIGNIKNNLFFQFVFKSFYGLDRAGLSQQQTDLYFEILADGGEINLKQILDRLYEIPNRRSQKTVQFSFVTKLLHTRNNTKPIFDTKIGLIINRGVIGIGKEEKIQSAESIYDDLYYLYHGLLNDDRVKKVIVDFKKQFKTGSMTDQKILDFLIWSFGGLEVKV